MPIPTDHLKNDILRSVLDAMPSAVLVVDEDVRIIDANRAALTLIGSSRDGSRDLLRAGEALHCLHAARHPEGCGRSAVCGDCIVRGAVQDALAGQQSLRRRTRMHLQLDDGEHDVYFHITASRFHYRGQALVLLVLEDISEFAELRSIVPICAQCKKVRQDADYWQSVESYVGRYMDLSFSHSYCPACKQALLRSIDTFSRKGPPQPNGR
jgi:transcriptional regulator of aromatic amino acid metabolism